MQRYPLSSHGAGPSAIEYESTYSQVRAVVFDFTLKNWKLESPSTIAHEQVALAS